MHNEGGWLTMARLVIDGTFCAASCLKLALLTRGTLYEPKTSLEVKVYLVYDIESNWVINTTYDKEGVKIIIGTNVITNFYMCVGVCVWYKNINLGHTYESKIP